MISAPARPADAGRMTWADSARGLSVLAVVIFHICLWNFLPHAHELWPPAARAWAKVNDVVGGVRIPVLLAVSGLVLSRTLRAGFGERRNVLRAVTNYYLYLVWLLVYAVFYAVVRYRDLPHRVDGPGDLAGQLLVPDTTLWYVFALAVFIVALCALRAVPPWLMVGASVLLCIGIRALDLDDVQAWKVPEVAVFFVVGVYGAGPIRALADRSSVLIAGALCVVTAAVTMAGHVVSGEYPTSVLFIVRGLAFMLSAVAVVALVTRWRPAGRAMSALGRQTLPVYVLHPLLIALLIVGAAHWSGYAAFLHRPVVSLAYPVVVLVVVVLACFAIRRVTTWCRLGALFALPGAARDKVVRAQPPVRDRTTATP